MTLRIIHVASGREWRGGQNQVRLLVRALAEHPEITQTVITGAGSELARRISDIGVQTVEPAWTAGLDPRVLVSILSQRQQGPSILHAHDAHSLALVGIATRVLKRPFVVTRRVDFHLRRPGFWNRADRVIAISNAIRDILCSDGIPPAKVTVVHSGIDPAEVRATPRSDIRRKLGLAPNLPLVVNVAALVPHKDHMTLLAAAASLNGKMGNVHWVIAGQGPLRETLMERSKALGLEDKVHFLGQVREPWSVMQEASVFAMSSKEEGLGTSILDAMALGVPVAATAAGGIPEMLNEGAGLLVPVGDGEGLANSIGELLMNPEVRRKTTRLASERLARFTHHAMADGVLAVYRSILPTG
jgi:glycosyltransferase involved in cell wall biosynthesis